MIGVIVTAEVKDGKQSEFETLLKNLIVQIRANEPGCLNYELYKSRESETQYVFMEQYATQDALDGHSKTEHVKAALPAILDCLAGPSKIQYSDLIE